jgi:hypothetical protein
MAGNQKSDKEKGATKYTVRDAIKVADDIIKFSQEKKYNLGAFIHGLIFALEYVEYSYKIPPKQIAEIKRDCRKYFKEIETIRS